MYRELTDADFDRLIERFDELPAHSEKLGKSWLRDIDREQVLHSILAGAVQARIVHGYLVLFTVGSPWYSTVSVLEECLVLRLYPGGTLRDVAAFLELEAEANGCVRVCVGTALANDRAIARVYNSAGFYEEARTLVKDLT